MQNPTISSSRPLTIRGFLLFIGHLILLWILCWLPLGCLLGKPTLLLQGSAPPLARMIYLAALYLGVTWVTIFHQKLNGLPNGYPLRKTIFLLLGITVGICTLGLHRTLLYYQGYWNPPSIKPLDLLLASFSALALALAEELLFRGFIFQYLSKMVNKGSAYLLSSSFFALVHIFRPGSINFKIAYFWGLLLMGILMASAVELTGNLWLAAGIHAAWAWWLILEGPHPIKPGLWSGIDGVSTAGAAGWMIMLLLITLCQGFLAINSTPLNSD